MSPDPCADPQSGPDTDSIIEFDDYSCELAGRKVLSEISFVIPAGQAVALVGPNGSGKSTLLRSVMKLYRGAGLIRIAGLARDRYSARDLASFISYLPQSFNEQIPVSAGDFVLMGRYPHLSPFRSPTGADRTKVERILGELDLTALAARDLSTLSGGERQKVFIAAALTQEPRLLLLDEPTSSLDPFQCEQVWSTLQQVRASHGISLLIATHDLNRAALCCDRVIALRTGRVYYDGGFDGFMNTTILAGLYGAGLAVTRHPDRAVTMVLPR